MKIVLKKMRSQDVTVKKLFSTQYFINIGHSKKEAERQQEVGQYVFRIDGDKVTSGLRNIAVDNVEAETLRNYAKLYTKLADLIETNTGSAE